MRRLFTRFIWKTEDAIVRFTVRALIRLFGNRVGNRPKYVTIYEQTIVVTKEGVEFRTSGNVLR